MLCILELKRYHANNQSRLSVDKLIKLTSQRCNNWNHIHIFPQSLIPSLIKHLRKIVPSIEWTHFWHRKKAILLSPFNIIDNHLLRSRIVSFTSDSSKLKSIWAAWLNDTNRYSLSDAYKLMKYTWNYLDWESSLRVTIKKKHLILKRIIVLIKLQTQNTKFLFFTWHIVL